MKNSETYNWDLFSVTETAEMKGHARGLEEGIAKGKAAGLEEGIAKGKAAGLEEGRAEGLEEGKKEVARSLKSLGIPPATIAQSTGLTAEEIEKL